MQKAAQLEGSESLGDSWCLPANGRLRAEPDPSCGKTRSFQTEEPWKVCRCLDWGRSSTRLLLRGSFGILGARSRHLEVVVSSSYPKSVAVLSPLPCGTGPSRALPSTGGESECPAATGGHRGGFRFSRKRDVSGVCSTCLVAPSYQIKGVTF